MNLLIETARTYLRLPIESDAHKIISFYIENKDHFAPWDQTRPDDFLTDNFWLQNIPEARLDFEKRKSCRHYISDKKSDIFIGMKNFTNIEEGTFKNCRLGYKIDKKFEGQGFMYEALHAAISFLFKEFAIHRIEANYMSENVRSAKILTQLGFEQHGVARRYLNINGEWRDHVLSSVLKEDFNLIIIMRNPKPQWR